MPELYIKQLDLLLYLPEHRSEQPGLIPEQPGPKPEQPEPKPEQPGLGSR